MYSTIICDDELLPIEQQVQMLAEKPAMALSNEKCQRLKQQLNRELDRRQISMREYISLSQIVIRRQTSMVQH